MDYPQQHTQSSDQKDCSSRNNGHPSINSLSFLLPLLLVCVWSGGGGCSDDWLVGWLVKTNRHVDWWSLIIRPWHRIFVCKLMHELRRRFSTSQNSPLPPRLLHFPCRCLWEMWSWWNRHQLGCLTVCRWLSLSSSASSCRGIRRRLLYFTIWLTISLDILSLSLFFLCLSWSTGGIRVRANLVSCRRIKSGLFWRQTYTKEIGRAKNPINQKFISYRRRDQQRGKVATPEETRIYRGGWLDGWWWCWCFVSAGCSAVAQSWRWQRKEQSNRLEVGIICRLKWLMISWWFLTFHVVLFFFSPESAD